MRSDSRVVLQRAATLRETNADWDSILLRLREEGYSKLECMLAVCKIEDISLGEAKEMVHFSPAWEDRREQDDQFHDALIDAVEKVDWSRR